MKSCVLRPIRVVVELRMWISTSGTEVFPVLILVALPPFVTSAMDGAVVLVRQLPILLGVLTLSSFASKVTVVAPIVLSLFILIE